MLRISRRPAPSPVSGDAGIVSVWPSPRFGRQALVLRPQQERRLFP
jgi:hypothetical protein